MVWIAKPSSAIRCGLHITCDTAEAAASCFGRPTPRTGSRAPWRAGCGSCARAARRHGGCGAVRSGAGLGQPQLDPDHGRTCKNNRGYGAPAWHLGCRAGPAEADGADITAAPSDPDRELEVLPVPPSDAPAVLSWTSGTTGSPKAFLLTHGNIAINIAALRDLGIIGQQDRALLPLPLHHAYPFILGMLATLTTGTTIVLPGASTGPAIARALRDGHVTAVIGVPRLYEALLPWRSRPRLMPTAELSAGMAGGAACCYRASAVDRASFGTASVRPSTPKDCPRPYACLSRAARGLKGRPKKCLRRSVGLCCPVTGSRKPPLVYR